MKQLSLPGINPPEKVVNVASVKHRSPFRYPGGKTWLVPRIRAWLNSLPTDRRVRLVEPFAGGAIVGLSAAFEQWVDHVILAELDDQVAAVWDAIINQGEGSWLAQQIRDFDLTPDSVDLLLGQEVVTCRDRAFQTIVKNRVNRGGILAPGAGRLKQGENGKGIASRWYPSTLARRIEAIHTIRERLSFVHGDGIALMQHHTQYANTVFFIDPPYTIAGKKPGGRLYACSDLDHEALFHHTVQLAGDFLMTYNNVPAVRALAARFGFECEPVAMKNTHHSQKTELLIGRDLGWLQSE